MLQSRYLYCYVLPIPLQTQSRRPSRCRRLLTRRLRLKARRLVMPSATSETVQRPKPVPRLTPFSHKSARDPSGQDAAPDYHAPLCGKPSPLGAHYDSSIKGVNFSIFSSSAADVRLVLFTKEQLQKGNVYSEIELDPIHNRTGDIWHIALPNIGSRDLLYGYRMSGLHEEKDEIEGCDVAGYRHDDTPLLLDPYGTTVIGRPQFGQLGLAMEDCGFVCSETWALSASCVPVDGPEFDWQGDRPLKLPLQDLVIYEMHVRGFTVDPSSQVSSPGTYKGLTEKLDYLRDLGMNCIELMPVHEFNELEYYGRIPGTDAYRFNYWGYSTINYLSPMSRYSAAVARGGNGHDLLTEFKTLIRECHKRGIEVLMDVVYNHTAEGNQKGPSLSFRGIDNKVYYMLAPGGEYYNYSGCGNTFNCNHPVVRTFILDSLRYWVTEMHVDGFRFDLASIMTRAHASWHSGEMTVDRLRLGIQGTSIDGKGHMESGAGEPTGTPLSDPTLIAMISEDPILRNTKLLAEAWDCDGLNQVGAFPHYGGRWAEWNGTFRDVVRNFIKGTDGNWAGDFAGVMCGSPNLYSNVSADESNWWRTHGGQRWSGGRGPMHSVNFVTAHDGFSLADLVSFSQKHNKANGEDNRDGETHNSSWNAGCEGLTTDIHIQSLRRRQIRNFYCALLLAHGVPMIVMGDEYGHSKGGNNNTYCHDDALNWFDWKLANERKGDLYRFVRLLTQFRHSRSELRRASHVVGDEIAWHGEKPNEPDWSEASRLVAYSIHSTNDAIYIAFNTSHVARTMELPSRNKQQWAAVIDTGMNAPLDVLIPDAYLDEATVDAAQATKTPYLAQGLYPMMPYSCIVLVTTPADKTASEKLF